MKTKRLLASLLAIVSLCSCERAIIPESRFIDIYHDIFLADSYICQNSDLYNATDSLMAYGDVIRRHGYSIEQFLAAQRFYTAHPEEFSRMMKTLQKRLNEERKAIEAKIQEDTTINFSRPSKRPVDTAAIEL